MGRRMSPPTHIPGKPASADGALVALEDFQRRFLDLHQAQRGGPPRQPFDPDWPSPCQRSAADADGLIDWLPVRREPPGSFDNIARALEIELHPDAGAYYAHYYSDALPASHPRGELNLLAAWSERDFARLQENLLGHLHAQRREKRPPTLFIATCEPDDSAFFISLDNASGAVLLEEVGRGPKERLADSLGEFLRQLQPRLA